MSDRARSVRPVQHTGGRCTAASQRKRGVWCLNQRLSYFTIGPTTTSSFDATHFAISPDTVRIPCDIVSSVRLTTEFNPGDYRTLPATTAIRINPASQII